MTSPSLPRQGFENKLRIVSAIRRSGRVVRVWLVPPDVPAEWANADPAILDPELYLNFRRLYGDVPASHPSCEEKPNCVAIIEFRTAHYSHLFATTRSGDSFRWFTFTRGKVRWVGGGNKFRGPRGCVAILKDGADEFLTMVPPDSRGVSDALAGRVRAFRFPFNLLSTPKDGIIEHSDADPRTIIEEFFRFRVLVC